ncbi:MAG: MFS transporter [Gammaproteobacteria bacterium]|nr:MFS transporter [Gammaproteobacteria bacterium]
MLVTEKRAAFSLALIYAFRMLGLFMILPVFSLYANNFDGVTPLLTGLAIGIYGLTQGLFQLPFGFLSDRFGRKKIIVLGLLIFAIGSIVAAEADSIYQVIGGRALQGLGAIAAVVMALAADLTREEVRLRVMAFIGMSIGLSFMISMVMGPLLAARYGLSLLFWITAGLALAGIAVVIFITPQPRTQGFHRDTQLSLADVGQILKNTELQRLDLGIFVLHLVLSATFVVFPLVLRDSLSIAEALHWKIYLPVFVLSVLGMVPLIIVAEKFGKTKSMFLLGIAIVLIAELGLAGATTYEWVFAMLVLFFTGFNFLEASLPTLVARIAPADMKGTAMGLFSCAQFFGAFSGGVIGGLLLASPSYSYGFLVLAGLLLVWWIVAVFMKTPQPVASRVVSLKDMEEEAVELFLKQASLIKGVQEVSVYTEDRVAYLKVEKPFDEQALKALLAR